MEGVHGGESLIDDTSPYGQLTLGDNTEGDRQRSAGDVSDIGGAVRSSQSQTDRVYGNGEVGEDEAVGDRPYDNDGIGTPVSGITEQDREAAEISEEVSAASLFEDEEDVSFHSKLQPIAYDYINNNKPYYDVPEERNELLKISYALRNHRKEIAAYFAEHENRENRSNYIKKFFDNTYSELIPQSGQRVGYRAYDDFLSIWRGGYPSREQEAFITWDKVADYISEIPLNYWLDEKVESLNNEGATYSTPLESYNFEDFDRAEQPEEGDLQDIGTYQIYQIKKGEEYHDLRFTGKDELERLGIEFSALSAENYDLIYEGKLSEIPHTDVLEGIYTKFNTNLPQDYQGHSLSVSDVVVINRNGESTAHFVDSFGFADMPEFVH